MEPFLTVSPETISQITQTQINACTPIDFAEAVAILQCNAPGNAMFWRDGELVTVSINAHYGGKIITGHISLWMDALANSRIKHFSNEIAEIIVGTDYSHNDYDEDEDE